MLEKEPTTTPFESKGFDKIIKLCDQCKDAMRCLMFDNDDCPKS